MAEAVDGDEGADAVETTDEGRSLRVYCCHERVPMVGIVL